MKLQIDLEFDVSERNNDHGGADRLLECLKEYFTSQEAPLYDDYGPDAWGGYNGAYIVEGRVRRAEVCL